MNGMLFLDMNVLIPKSSLQHGSSYFHNFEENKGNGYHEKTLNIIVHWIDLLLCVQVIA
jgi:hypothetical protein